MEKLKQQLIEGKTINFDNEQFCNANQIDDVRSGSIQKRESFGTMVFLIWFNGTLIHSCKTWKSCENRKNTLFNKWNCEITDIED
jgi:hypothetical protein